jgi:hypothetical protein
MERDYAAKFVLAGLVPGIHVLAALKAKDVDGRDKPGHDEKAGFPLFPIMPANLAIGWNVPCFRHLQLQSNFTIVSALQSRAS